MTKAVTIVLVAFLGLLLSRSALPDPAAEAVPSCSTTVTELKPCWDFVTGKNNKPSQACCGGVKDICGKVTNHQDMVDVCNCLKGHLPNSTYDASRVSLVPKKCGIHITFPPLNSTTNCSKAL